MNQIRNIVKKEFFWLIIIGLLAAFLRLYQLGVNPPSLDWDEASLGYNAYSLLKTGKDEYGVSWPLAIRSFGDYKPPLYTYVSMIPIALFGLTEFAVRLPSAVLGVVAVVCTYFLVRDLIVIVGKKTDRSAKTLGLLSALFLAISPWHLQFSRVAFEANLGLTFFIAGTWFFIKGLQKGWYLPISAVLFIISLYAYHSPRLVAPVFLAGLGFGFYQQLLKHKKYLIFAILLGILAVAPLAVTFFQGGQARFESVTSLSGERLNESIGLIESDQRRNDRIGVLLHNRRIVYLLTVIEGYLDHFDPNFLFLTGDGPARHHAADMGVLYQVELPFVLMGLFLIITRHRRWGLVILWWYVVAPLASALTTGTPHAVRALLYLPTYQIMTSVGVYHAFVWIRRQSNKILRVGFQLAIIVCFSINIGYYLHMYYVHSPVEHAREWQYGYKEAIEVIKKYEDSVDRIIMTYAYDQPYIFALFYGPVDSQWYQEQWGGGQIERSYRAFGKYEFRAIDWELDKDKKSVLLVGTPSEIPAEAPGKVVEIPFPDGTIAFRIVAL